MKGGRKDRIMSANIHLNIFSLPASASTLFSLTYFSISLSARGRYMFFTTVWCLGRGRRGKGGKGEEDGQGERERGREGNREEGGKERGREFSLKCWFVALFCCSQ